MHSSFLRVVKNAAVAAVVSFGFAAEGFAGDADFKYQSTMTVQGYGGAELSDFPVLVRVSSARIAGFDYADVAADGSDVRFYDADGQALPFELDAWNPEGESTFWVKLPTLASGVAFKMCWGKLSAAGELDANDPTDVWSAYVGVWHMNEPSGDVADATGHGLTATPMGNTLNSFAVSGAPTGVGRQTANSSAKGYLLAPSYDSFELGSTFTIMGWVKQNGCNGYPRIFSRKQNYTDDNGWEIEVDGSSYTRLAVRGVRNDPIFTATIDSTDNAWVNLAFSYNDDKATVYSNGRSVAEGSVTPATDNDLPLAFGCDTDGSEAYLFASFDEVRLFDGAADPVRLAADCATVTNADFLSCSAQESLLPFAVTRPQVAYDALTGRYTLSFSVTEGTVDLEAVVTDATGAERVTAIAEGAAPGDYTAVVSKLTSAATVRLGIRAQAGGVTCDCLASGDFVNREAFGKCATITVSGYEGGETLVDFPVAVRLGASEGFAWDEAGANGAQIRFVGADGRILPHEIESWPADTTAADAAALVWVKPPTLSRGTALTMYWQSAAAESAAAVDPTSVWSAYVGVWHMNEPDGEPVADATGHGLMGTPTGKVEESLRLADTPTGAGRQVCNSSTASAIVVPSYDSFELGGRFAISGWAKTFEGNNGWPRIFSRKNDYQDAGGWEVEAREGSPTSFTCRGSKNDKHFDVTLPSLQTAWRHVVFSFDGKSVDVYGDGELRVDGGVIDAAYDNGYPLGLGNNARLSSAAYRCAFDEIRLKRAPMSAAWAKAEAASVADPAFASVGAASEIIPADICQVSVADVVRDGADWVLRYTILMGEGDVYAVVTDIAAGQSSDVLCAEGVGPGAYQQALSGLEAGKEYAIAVKTVTGDVELTKPAGVVYTGAISIAAGDSADLSKGQTGSFVVSLPSGVTLANDLVVNLSVGGTAEAGVDYEPIPAQVVIPAGEGSVTVTVTPKWNAAATVETSVAVTLAPGGYDIAAGGASAAIAVAPTSCRWKLEGNTLVELAIDGTPWVLNVSVANSALTVSSVAQVGDNPTLDLSETAWPEGCPPLTTLGKQAIAGQTSILELRLPETLTTIGDDAIHDCSSLTNIVPCLPASVKSIGLAAFYGCRALTCDIVMSNPLLTTIPDCHDWSVFKFCPLHLVDMSKSGIKNICYAAFADVTSDMVVKMPKDIATIGGWAFSRGGTFDCYWQTIPVNLSIGTGAFNISAFQARHFIPEGDAVWESYLTKNCSPTDLTDDELAAYQTAYPNEPIPVKKVKIASEGKWHYLLYWDPNAECELTLDFREGVGTVETELISGRKVAEGIYEKGSVVKLTFVPGEGIAFSSWVCAGLSDEDAKANPLLLTMDSPKEITLLVDGVPWTYDVGTKTVTDGLWVLTVTEDASGSLTITGVKTAPSDDSNLNIGGSPEGHAFVAIGQRAFAGRERLSFVRLPETLTTIGGDAFSGCTALRTVTPFLPASVSSIGIAAFGSCPIESALVLSSPNLTEIPEVQDYGVFKGSHIPTADLSRSGLVKIGASAFQNDKCLTHVALPPTLKVIGSSAFHGCILLEGIELPEGLTTIGRQAFSDCVSMKSVTPFLPTSVSSIGVSAFYDCPVTNGLLLANRDLTELPENSNYGIFTHAPLSTVDMSKSGITKIGKMTFADGGSRVTFKMPKVVETIGQWAFSTSPSGQKCNDFHWQTISPNLFVDTESFYEPTGLMNRHFIPGGDSVWQEYLTTKCTFEPLTDQEKADYKAKYPGEKMPAGKFLFPSSTKFWQYAIFTSNGMILFLR